MEQKQTMVRCPACSGPSVYAPTNAWRPFCSQRCKQVDFGAWASEEFRVAGRIEELDPSELATLHEQSATRH